MFPQLIWQSAFWVLYPHRSDLQTECTMHHTTASANNWYMGIRTWPDSSGRMWPGLMNQVLFNHMDGWVCVYCLQYGKNQAGSASVMLWAMLGNLGSWCYFDSYTYLSITIGLPVLMKARLFMGTVFPDVCGLCQCDNTACHKTKMVQEWFTEHNNRFEVLTSNVDLQSSICVQTVPIHRGRTSQLTRLKLDLDFCRKFMS